MLLVDVFMEKTIDSDGDNKIKTAELQPDFYKWDKTENSWAKTQIISVLNGGRKKLGRRE